MLSGTSRQHRRSQPPAHSICRASLNRLRDSTKLLERLASSEHSSQEAFANLLKAVHGQMGEMLMIVDDMENHSRELVGLGDILMQSGAKMKEIHDETLRLLEDDRRRVQQRAVCVVM